ncbi:hypothetical protein pclt_cds_798 [Pandoravirus celtis]|uniref:Uncharacterized protein n=1 Tax=Pandoravirus celtis TaxID=2568002 RepID=A0A4D6EHW6_9VIRU|nr:hypothetical protein pclt_cds_798 [Pandoravirus celtis]
MIRASSVVASHVRAGWRSIAADTKNAQPPPPAGAFRQALLAAINKALCARNLVDHNVDEEDALSVALCAVDTYLATPEARLLCPVVACLSARNFETLARDAIRAHRRRALLTGPLQNAGGDNANDETH